MRIADLRVTPVAIADPPLRSAFGLHAPFALRTIVEVETADGVVGLSETYGGEAPLRSLLSLREIVVGRDPFGLTALGLQMEGQSRVPGDYRPWEARALVGPALFGALEVACLDAIGKTLGRPLCELLGGAVRDRVPFSAYLFYKHAGDDEWGEVLTPDALLAEARCMRERYGFGSLKLKGGVLEPDVEVETIRKLRGAFGPDVGLRLDPNAAWSVPTSLRVVDELAGTLEYLEDPTPGIDGMARVAAGSPIPLATNMCVTAFEHIPAAVAKRAVGIILSDHHIWGGMRATLELARICRVFGLGISMHSNSHLGISLAAMVHVAAALPELTYACDTHYPWQIDEVIRGGKLRIEDGAVTVPAGGGLGVELDRAALAEMHERYLATDLRARDDVAEMRRLVPDWRPHVGDW